MKKQFSFLFLVLFVTSVSFAQNRSIQFEHGTFAELLAKAKKENKMIFIDCYTTWCGPCKWMAKNVFTNDTAADFYNKNFVNAKIDMENGEGIEIAKKYGIQAYPTLLYINSDGTQMHRICGAGNVKSFVADGEDAMSPNKQLASITKTFNVATLTSEIAASYFSMLDKACQNFDSEINTYFSSVKENELTSRGNWGIIYQYVNDYYSKAFQVFEKNKDAFSKLYSYDSVETKLNSVYANGIWTALKKKEMAEYEAIKAKLQNSKSKEAEKILLKIEIAMFQQSQEWAKYASTVSNYISKCSVENPGELNSYAWTFYEKIEDKMMLEKAESWVKKAIDLHEDWAFYDTYAAVQFKLGKKADAQKNAQKAIELAKKSGADAKETEALLEKINALK
jgi:thiol-disulfide isomerase/thioredoxin